MDTSQGKPYLYALGVRFDFAPADCLVWSRTSVATIEFLCRVDVDCVVGAVSHQAGVCDVVLHDPAAQDNHACPLGPMGNLVDAADVLDDIDFELQRRGLEGVEVEHVTKTTVCEGWAEDGNPVLVGPVVN